MPAELTANQQEQEMKINSPESEGVELELFSQEDLENFAKAALKDINDKSDGVLDDGKESFNNANRSIELNEAGVIETAQETGADKELEAVQQEIDLAPREATQEITAVVNPEDEKTSQEMAEDKALIQGEQSYLSNRIAKGKANGLEARYDDEKTGADYIQKQIGEFAEKSGLSREASVELADKKFNPDTKKFILDKTKEHIDRLLLDKKEGRFNPEKHKIVNEQVERYLNFIEQAQLEGDLSLDLDAQAVLDMARENVWTLAYQDRVASENMLGDHGIRHIAGYNIRVTEEVFKELDSNGQGVKVKAVDKLMAHQIMIMHDLGYATDPVREGVNAGNFAADAGHNLLSAKILRQRGENKDDAMSKLFSKEQLAIMHQGVLEHDDSKVDFRVADGSAEARKENLLSAVHLADNTHAFEDKLPELLYSSPDSLKTMRLLKTAGEIGDETLENELKQQLIKQIKENPDYSKDDKEALEKAAKSLKGKSYERAVGRICGNQPKVTIDSTGAVEIKVQESAIHQEAIGLFGEKAYDQLKKFIEDLTGIDKKEVTEEILNQPEIVGKDKKVKILLDIGDEKKSNERSDYQIRIETMIKDQEFREYSDQDLKMSKKQSATKKVLDFIVNDAEKSANTTQLNNIEALYRTEGDNRSIREILEERIDGIKKKRSELFSKYNKPK